MAASGLAHGPVPDVTFSEPQLAAARDVLERDLGGPCRVGLAFVGGSLAAGLGHITSPVELGAIGTLPATDGQVVDRGGVAVRVRVVQSCAAHELLGLAQTFRLSDARHPQAGASWEDLGELVNLATGRVLHASLEWRHRLDALRPSVLRELLIARHAGLGAASAREAFGALISGDLHTAHSLSEAALVAACEAVLCARGDLHFGRKFLLRRLARAPMERECRERLTRLFGCPVSLSGAADPARVRRLVDERLLAANMLLSWAVVEGWDADAEPPVHTVAAEPTGGPRRSPYFAPVRYADGHTLSGPSGTFEVSEAMLRLWRRLDGRHLDELGRMLTRHERGLATAAVDDLDRAVRALQTIGAVEFAPSRPGMPQLGTRSVPGRVRAGALTLEPSTRTPLPGL
ncbi:hypothetical protein [Saccharomonospora saliphila]|uniref:hypothetical protein n=1 Tax=Saccharomonospora saliphila TaxID=369829 RepID=UPI0003820FE1|nr:hypothetical protein [Saccharomonospora saliphila]